MPKVGMEAPRRAALVQATVAEVGAAGSLDVSVAQIARRAGMSSALAHHYFGSKQRIFSAAMRYILTAYGNSVRARLAVAQRLTVFRRHCKGELGFSRISRFCRSAHFNGKIARGIRPQRIGNFLNSVHLGPPVG